MITEITDKTLADFAEQTATYDKEVPVYDAEGEIKHFWRGQVFEGGYAVTTIRKPGKHPKLVEIRRFDGNATYSGAYYAEANLKITAEEREKRVPVIRIEKAKVKLRQMIQESGTNLNRFTGWSWRSGCVLYTTEEEVLKLYGHSEAFKDDDKKLEAILARLRKEGDSYFGGLKLAKRYIEQLKPGGLADQTLAGVIDVVEKHLVPWAYVAGYLRRPVMECQSPRELAVRLIDKHADVPTGGDGFYPEGSTAEGLVKRVYENFVEDIKPDVLDALTLE